MNLTDQFLRKFGSADFPHAEELLRLLRQGEMRKVTRSRPRPCRHYAERHRNGSQRRRDTEVGRELGALVDALSESPDARCWDWGFLGPGVWFSVYEAEQPERIASCLRRPLMVCPQCGADAFVGYEQVLEARSAAGGVLVPSLVLLAIGGLTALCLRLEVVDQPWGGVMFGLAILVPAVAGIVAARVLDERAYWKEFGAIKSLTGKPAPLTLAGCYVQLVALSFIVGLCIWIFNLHLAEVRHFMLACLGAVLIPWVAGRLVKRGIKRRARASYREAIEGLEDTLVCKRCQHEWQCPM